MSDSYRRHKDFDPALLGKVLKQAEEKGAGYVTATISDEARKVYRCASAVGCESHLATGYLRFKELVENELVARADFEHDVVDIVLSHFMRRFPMKKVVIISNDVAYAGQNNRIFKEPASMYAEVSGQTDQKPAGADAEWITYYDSQYIEARRNRKLAMRHIPKKLWKKFGLEEASKIDKGILGNTLSDFL